MKNVVLETIQWATLPHIHDVRPIGEKDHEVLNDLREVLQRHGYTHRSGICLLHKHFDVDSDECLVEYTRDGQSNAKSSSREAPPINAGVDRDCVAVFRCYERYGLRTGM